MGIEFSHGGACWSYSGFMRFRSELVKPLGIKSLQDLYASSMFGPLKGLENEAILPLIERSDCEAS